MKKGFIVLADNNMADIKPLRRYLDNAGHEVIEAYSGADCLEKVAQIKASNKEIDCVIIGRVRADGDILKMDEKELIKKFRLFYHHKIPLILIIPANYCKDSVEAISMGVDDYLTKPIEEKTLLAKVKIFVRLSRAEKKLNDIYKILNNCRMNDTNKVWIIEELFDIERFFKSKDS
jgi:two-component system cell cycle response regulator